MLAYVLRRTSPGVADDVVADVFLVAWRKLDHLPAEPLPWLLGTARKLLANRRRGEERMVALHRRLASAHDAVTAGSEGAVDERAVNERVIRALAHLSERDRELLMLLAWEELSQAEAAEVLGLRKNTVAVRLHRARRQFAEALAAEDTNTPHRMEVPR